MASRIFAVNYSDLVATITVVAASQKKIELLRSDRLRIGERDLEHLCGCEPFYHVEFARTVRALVAALFLLPPWCALISSTPVWAQSATPPRASSQNGVSSDEPEEVIVRGRRLADFRAELQAARVRVYALFNDLNSDDAFDVHCQVEDSTGTRMRQHVCRPQFKDDISAAAARAWMDGIRDACGGQLTQVCIFGEAASAGKSRALAEEGWEPIMQKRFAVEMARVVADNPEMQQAILDYEAVERAYDDARGGRRSGECDTPQPPRRCSR